MSFQAPANIAGSAIIPGPQHDTVDFDAFNLCPMNVTTECLLRAPTSLQSPVPSQEAGKVKDTRDDIMPSQNLKGDHRRY